MTASSAMVWDDTVARRFLQDLFTAAIASADPSAGMLKPHLPDPPAGKCIVVGAGKAAASMAAAVDAAWPDVPLSGVVVVPYGYGMDIGRIRVREAAHPVPDAQSEQAAREILAAVRGLTPDDLVLVLISGGGSSVLALPADGISLADKQDLNRRLLASGLDIRTMNAIRRRFSAIKGGKLLQAAAPARVVTLAISDIPGDDIAAIASGPSVPDPGAHLDLSCVHGALGPDLPAHILAQLRQVAPTRAPAPEIDARLVATPRAALEAAAAFARAHNVKPVILGDDIEGDSAQVAAAMANEVRAAVTTPTVYLSGGETTVTLTGGRAGRGGRNTEFVLSAVTTLDGDPQVWLLAGDTDGEDGASGGAAGAIGTPDTLERARAAGIDVAASLRGHDSATLFAAIGDLIITGPTRTNVNDFRAILVIPECGHGHSR